MDDVKDLKIKQVEKVDTDKTERERAERALQTNPIMKRLIDFHLEKASKLTVLDIFRK